MDSRIKNWEDNLLRLSRHWRTRTRLEMLRVRVCACTIYMCLSVLVHMYIGLHVFANMRVRMSGSLDE